MSMSERVIESPKEQRDPRVEVYDLLGELDKSSVPHALRLFVMGGQRGMAGGYFFEKDSASYIHSIREVVVSDEEGNEVNRLDAGQVFHAFRVNPPDWLEEGKKYQVSKPEVSREEAEKLWRMRSGILRRLRAEGLDAAREFLLAGIAMGGEEEDADEVASDITSRITDMLQAVRDREK